MANERNYHAEEVVEDAWNDGYQAALKIAARRSARQNRRIAGMEPRRAPEGVLYGMLFVMIAAVVIFAVWLYPDILPPTSTPIIIATQPAGAIGRQAPPSAVRRAPAAPAQQPVAAPDVQQGIDAYNATAQAQYDAAAQQQAAPVPTAPPLPLNSAGQPIIDAAQQAQQAQSLQLAEQEGAAAVDRQLAAQREAANADAQSRPPDVSKADAEQMLHRPLCSVPRANPATCESGLYKPTPVQ